MVGFLITDGGAHPADKWAEIMADDVLALIQIEDGADSEAARAARRAKRDLAVKLLDMFEAAGQQVQDCERDACRHKARLQDSLDPEPHTPQTMADFDALIAATPFAAHFAKPEVRAHIHNIMRQRFASIMNVERQLAASKGA